MVDQDDTSAMSYQKVAVATYRDIVCTVCGWIIGADKTFVVSKKVSIETFLKR